MINTMTLTQRLGLAEEAYAKAIRVVRAMSTPGTWKRLVRAAENLRDALRVQHTLSHADGRSGPR